MNSIVRFLVVASAAVSLGARADAGDDLLAEGEEKPVAETASEAEGAAPAAARKTFASLPYCSVAVGTAEVLYPGKSDWQPVEEGHHLTLGTTFRTVGKDSCLRLEFGPDGSSDASVTITGDSSFSTRAQQIGDKDRAITLISGQVTVKLPPNLKEGLFSVMAPGFTVKNPVGESRYAYRKTGDGDEAIVRCVTQTLSIEGPHFEALSLKAANELRIRTSQDQLMTSLYGTRGDIAVRLDQGVVSTVDPETGDAKSEQKFLDWRLSPKTAVRIHRARLSVGTRMVVTTMTFNARGELCNQCAFAEGMPEVNSGEIGPEFVTPKDKKVDDKADDTVDTAVETVEVETPAAADSAAEDAPAAGGDDLDF